MHPYEFLQRYGPAALVMEVTGDIGAALAAELAKGGFDLVLPSHDPDALESLAARLRDHEGVEVDLFSGDIDAPHFPEQLYPACEHRDIGLLVCGIEAGHPRMAGSLLSSLTRVFMPRLRQRQHAGVIVVDMAGSTRRLGETLAHELKPEGIDVMTLQAEAGNGSARALAKVALEHMGHDQYVAFDPA